MHLWLAVLWISCVDIFLSAAPVPVCALGVSGRPRRDFLFSTWVGVPATFCAVTRPRHFASCNTSRRAFHHSRGPRRCRDVDQPTTPVVVIHRLCMPTPPHPFPCLKFSSHPFWYLSLLAPVVLVPCWAGALCSCMDNGATTPKHTSRPNDESKAPSPELVNDTAVPVYLADGTGCALPGSSSLSLYGQRCHPCLPCLCAGIRVSHFCRIVIPQGVAVDEGKGDEAVDEAT